MVEQCGTCIYKPVIDHKFKACFVTLRNYTIVNRDGLFVLENDLTGMTEMINCKHYVKKG